MTCQYFFIRICNTLEATVCVCVCVYISLFFVNVDKHIKTGTIINIVPVSLYNYLLPQILWVCFYRILPFWGLWKPTILNMSEPKENHFWWANEAFRGTWKTNKTTRTHLNWVDVKNKCYKKEVKKGGPDLCELSFGFWQEQMNNETQWSR